MGLFETTAASPAETTTQEITAGTAFEDLHATTGVAGHKEDRSKARAGEAS